MKTLLKLSTVLLLVMVLQSCNNNEKKIESTKKAENKESTDKHVSASDKLFIKAIKDFDENYTAGSESILNEAIMAIEYEGAGLDGIQKNAFKNAINDLKTLNNKIKDGKHVTKHQLLQAIANVRYPLYNPAFQEETAIVIAKPNEEKTIKLNRALEESKQLFESENKKFDAAMTKDMEILKKENEQIEKLQHDLQAKMISHLKKTQEFLKKNNPENYDETLVIWMDKQ